MLNWDIVWMWCCCLYWVILKGLFIQVYHSPFNSNLPHHSLRTTVFLHDAPWYQSLRRLPASNFGVSVFEFRVAYEWTSWHYNAAIRTKIDKQFISVHKSNLCRYLSIIYGISWAVTQCGGRRWEWRSTHCQKNGR